MHSMNEQVGVVRHPLGRCQQVDRILGLKPGTFRLGIKHPNHYSLPPDFYVVIDDFMKLVIQYALVLKVTDENEEDRSLVLF